MRTTSKPSEQDPASDAAALGFRVEPAGVHWAVVTGSRNSPKVERTGKLVAPKALSTAAALTWYRTQVLSLIQKHTPAAVALRDAEKAKSANVASMMARARIEGVVVEIANSLGLTPEMLRLNTISSKLGSKRAKAYIETGEFRGIELDEFSSLIQEAILVATSILEIHASPGND